VELLKPTGGKIHTFVTSLPNAGSRALKMRDGNATLAEKEKQMGLLPQDNTYLSLAAQAADFNVSTNTTLQCDDGGTCQGQSCSLFVDVAVH
jgi:protein transport protein SEC24